MLRNRSRGQWAVFKVYYKKIFNNRGWVVHPNKLTTYLLLMDSNKIGNGLKNFHCFMSSSESQFKKNVLKYQS